MPRPVLRRIALGSVALALGLAACGSDDVSRSDLQEGLEDGGMAGAQAECVADALFADLDQGEINELYEADDLSGALQDAGDAALEECADA